MNANPTPYARAVKAAGGQAALARIIGVSQPTVWHVLNGKRAHVPIKHCLPIEEALGIKAEELRPDINWDYQRRLRAAGAAQAPA